MNENLTLSEPQEEELTKLKSKNIPQETLDYIRLTHKTKPKAENINTELKKEAIASFDQLERDTQLKISALDPLIVGLAIIDIKNEKIA